MKTHLELSRCFPSAVCPRCLGSGRHLKTSSGYRGCFECRGEGRVLTEEGSSLLREFLAANSYPPQDLKESWWVLHPKDQRWKQIASVRRTIGDVSVRLLSGDYMFLHPSKRIFSVESPPQLANLVNSFLKDRK